MLDQLQIELTRNSRGVLIVGTRLLEVRRDLYWWFVTEQV